VAVNGKQAVDTVQLALEAGEPYNLICLDIMMPKLDGHAALKQIRDMEQARGICSTNGAKIVMTTAVNNMKNVNEAFGSLCDAYLVKPVGKEKLIQTLRELKLIP
jgi:two-component system chemotaxis response regulator CheY